MKRSTAPKWRAGIARRGREAGQCPPCWARTTGRVVGCLVGAIAAQLLLGGCKKDDMAQQPRYKPYQASEFFADGTSARPVPAGTVPRGPAGTAAGATLVEEGSSGHEFYLILEGRATVRKGTRKIATLGPGQYFGELAVLDPAPRNASVVAESLSTIPGVK